MQGFALGRHVRLWKSPRELKPPLPVHGQVNWVGLRAEGSVLLAFMNDGEAGEVNCHLNSRDALGHNPLPKAVHETGRGGVVNLPRGKVDLRRFARMG